MHTRTHTRARARANLNTVLELICLQDFSEVTSDEFNLRRIIDYMQKRHRLNAFAINDQMICWKRLFTGVQVKKIKGNAN